MEEARMEKARDKEAKPLLEDQHKDLMKSYNPSWPVVPQWTSEGDVFVKFSLYKQQQTIAAPHLLTKKD